MALLGTRLTVVTLAGALAFASPAQPASAQVPDSGKAVKKYMPNKPMVDPKKIQAAPSLIQPPGPTGTTAGPIDAVPPHDTVFIAASPCGDADTVQIGGSIDTVEVPNVVGMQENNAHILLDRKRLFHRSREVPLARTTGVVFAQATPAGTRVAPGTWLRLCWAGPPEVPDVVHLTRERAGSLLAQAGYQPVERKAEIPDGARGQGDSAGSTGPCKRGQRCRGHDHSRCPGHGRGAAGRGPLGVGSRARDPGAEPGARIEGPSPTAPWYRARSRCRTVGSTPGHGWT